MPYRLDAVCPACKQYHVVIFESPKMRAMDARVRYVCPASGKTISDSCAAVEPVQSRPPDAIDGTME